MVWKGQGGRLIVKCAAAAAAADSLRLHIDGTVDLSLVTNCDCILHC